MVYLENDILLDFLRLTDSRVILQPALIPIKMMKNLLIIFRLWLDICRDYIDSNSPK